MTLTELLEHPTLGLRKLGGEAHASRPIQGVQVVEFPGEAEGLQPGSVALTTGVWMGRHPERQRAFAAALKGRALALGLHEGAVIPAMPEALRRACLEAGIAVFAIPHSTPLEAIGWAIAASLPALPLEAAQQALLEALEHSGDRGLVSRLAELSGLAVAYFAPWGQLSAGAGDFDPVGLWQALHHPTEREWLGEALGQVACSLPVRAGGRTQAVLVALAPDAEALGRARATLDFARRLLAVSLPERVGVIDQERLVRGGLLRELLLEPWNPELSPARLRAFGFTGEPVALAVVEVRDPWARQRESRQQQLEFRVFQDALRRAGEEFFSARGLPFLTGFLSEVVLLAWQSPRPREQLEGLRAALTAVAPASDTRLGLSSPHLPPDLPAAHREALLAAESVLQPRGSASWEELEPTAWVVATAPLERLRPVFDATLGAIRRHDPAGRLERTLRTHLELGRNLNQTAAHLGLHVNTVRKRLRQLEAILGDSLESAALLASLRLALLAERRLLAEGR
ncbi:helix-turn-helix domain-containing protein [Calidithermus timidus]|uniref:helix-turn-helix domain-containing protein n=1 Tax=Calidithermus timidus TaxID=307124 RepID=UPI0003710418|nr:PucR family transcriptional regulator [Calidithermus timidus]